MTLCQEDRRLRRAIQERTGPPAKSTNSCTVHGYRTITMAALTSVKAPEDIACFAADSAELDTVNVKCFCSRDYGKYISCFIETGQPAASKLAKAMGGDVIGDKLVNFIVAIPPDFACKGRDARQVVTSGRCLCRRYFSKQETSLAA